MYEEQMKLKIRELKAFDKNAWKWVEASRKNPAQTLINSNKK